MPAHTLLGDVSAPKTALVLHGILGAGRNWRGFVRRLSIDYPGWRFVLPDHRFHGESGPVVGPHTVQSCAEDLVRLVEGLGCEPSLVIGHSFGGKVALSLARDVRLNSLRQVVVLDAVPGRSGEAQTVSNNDVLRVISAIRSTVTPAEERRIVKSELAACGIPLPIVEWLATSLREGSSGWTWCFEIDAVSEMMASYFETDFWDYLIKLDEGPEITFVRAARSDRWSADEISRFSESRANLLVLPNAGHWLHVDNPAGLTELLGPFLGNS